MIYWLMIGIVIAVLLSMTLFGRDITAPSFLMCAAFFASVLCACINNANWDFNNYLLLVVILSGIGGFILFSFCTYLLDKRGKSSKALIPHEIKPIYLKQWKLAIYFGLEAVLYVYQLILVLRTAGMGISNIAYAIGYYYEGGRSGLEIQSSPLVNIGTIINMPGVYLLIYIWANNIVCKAKSQKLLYATIFMAGIGSLINGTRTTLFMYFTCFVISYILLKQKQSGWKRNLKISTMLKMIGLAVGTVLFFNVLTYLQGRTVTDLTAVELISNYIGAPLKNLELFINDGPQKAKVFGGATLADSYQWLYELTGNKIFDIPNLYKYRWFNGKILGNVYTLFMPLYNDFGIWGTFLVSGVLGVISQKVYDNIKYDASAKTHIDRKIIYFSYIAFAIIFSFFSNKFFELVIARAMLYFVISLFLHELYFFKISIYIGNRRK